MSEQQNRTSKDQFMLRLPDGFRDRIKEIADVNKRSMNAEIVSALEAHLELFGIRSPPPFDYPGPFDYGADSRTDDDETAEVTRDTDAIAKGLLATERLLFHMRTVAQIAEKARRKD